MPKDRGTHAAITRWFDKDGKLTHCEWFCNGKRHRIDGPARESFVDVGTKLESVYWLDDINVTEEEHHRHTAILKIQTKITTETSPITL
jgi:hypothetical protein